MSNGAWQHAALGDAGAWVSGGTPSTSNPAYWGGQIPWMSSKSLTEFKIHDSDRRVTSLGAESGTRVVSKDTILMVVRGMSLKSEFRMGITQREVALSQALKGLIPRSDIEPTFLAYALKARTPEVLDMVDEAGHGTGRLQTDRLFALKLGIPPMAEQREIVATLGALDNKLDSNQRLISLIPKMIRARIVASVSRDSSTISVASLALFVNGGAYTEGASGTGRMVLRIAELNSGPGRSTVYSDIEVPEDKTAHAGDILMSWSGSLDVYRWFRDEAIINQHIFKVIPTGYPRWLVFDRLGAAMPLFQGIARDKATTMGHIQRGHLESTTVELPSSRTIEELDFAIGPLWERLLLAERENAKLEALRDALLSELLSGRFRIPEVQEVLA